MSDIRILAINPGSTSTKFAVYFGDECKLKKTLRHSIEELSLYENIIDQFEFRKGLIIDALLEEGFDVDKIIDLSASSGMGFSNIYSRINSLKGEIKVESEHKKGTVVNIKVLMHDE